jgi:hypothetical protein
VLAAAAVDSVRLYPDPEARALREALAVHHNVKPEQVFVGIGPPLRTGGLADSRMHARYIEENTRLQLLLVEPVLHQIADTHDAPQPAVLDDRKVTDPSRRHGCEDSVDAVRGATTEDRCRHQFLDIKAEYGVTLPGHRVDEVPLGEDADRFHPPILDDQGADAVLGELADR